MAAEAAFEAHVSGRVQGVGFRYHTRSQAHKLGLRGWVRNEPDGSVTVRAEGPQDAISKFQNWLRRGPPGARVDTIDLEPRQAQGLYSRFSIEQ